MEEGDVFHFSEHTLYNVKVPDQLGVQQRGGEHTTRKAAGGGHVQVTAASSSLYSHTYCKVSPCLSSLKYILH